MTSGLVLPRLFEQREPVRPLDVVLETESSEALRSALAVMSPAERELLTRAEPDWSGPAGRGPRSGAERVRATRARAKLRVEFLLALRRVELPSSQCRPVLISISAGDKRRQQALDVARHLMGCGVCASLSAPLSRRSLPMAGLTVPVVAARWLSSKARSHPGPATAVGAVSASAAAIGVALALHSPAQAPARPPTSASIAAPSDPPPQPLVAGLIAEGHELPASPALTRFSGATVTATGVRVQSVVTHDGFWAGAGTGDRVWVEMVGPLRSIQVTSGEHLDFTGTVVLNGSNYAASLGMPARAGAGLLGAEGAHVEADTASISPA